MGGPGGFEKTARARQAQDILRDTSEMVWGAIPEAASGWFEDLRSRPDYDQDFVSHGEGAMSRRGPEYWTEKEEVEDQWNIDQADRIGEECRSEAQKRAAQKCRKRQLPNGTRDEHIDPAECMQFWADGMPDEIVSSALTKEQTSGSSHELALEGEASANVGVGKVTAKGALRKSGGESTTASESRARSMTRRGHEGYVRECAQLENDWFMERLKAMEGYGE